MTSQNGLDSKIHGRKLTIGVSLSYFIFSLVINAAGNVLTVVTSQKYTHPF